MSSCNKRLTAKHNYVTFNCNRLGVILFQILSKVYMFGFGKRKLAKKMIQGVDEVRLVLYTVLTDDFSKKYQDNGERFYKTLAGTVINEIFCSHSETTQQITKDNKEIVTSEIKNIGINHPALKRPITDAVRVFAQANFMLSGEWQPIYQEILDKARERDILIKDGEPPNPKEFLEMTSLLISKYNLR